MKGNDTSAYLCGELAEWPLKDELATILRSAGLTVSVGNYAVRVKDCSHFSFENYGGDICDPTIEADAETPERIMREAGLVSEALARALIRMSGRSMRRCEIFRE